MNEAARVFSGLWPAVMDHYTRMPTDVPEMDVLQQAIHLRVAFTDLHQENVELEVALEAWPALLNPAIVYIVQITKKQGQVTKMQEALSTTT